MAIVNTKSTQVGVFDTLAAGTSQVRPEAEFTRGILKTCGATVATASNDTAASTYRFVRIPSHAVVTDINVLNDALTGGTAYSIGLYNTAANGGAAVNANLFANGITMATARTTAPFNARFSNSAITTINQRLWQLLGLQLDPKTEYDLVVTAGTPGSVVGNIALQVKYAAQ